MEKFAKQKKLKFAMIFRRPFTNSPILGIASRSFEYRGDLSHIMTELLESVITESVKYFDDGGIKTSASLVFKSDSYPSPIKTRMILIGFMFLLLKHIYPRMQKDWTTVVP